MDQIKKYIIALTNLYGIVPIDKVVEIYNMEWSSQTGHAKLFFSPLIAVYLINTLSFSVTQGDVYINWRLTLD
jgi:hypothetical protein